MKIGNVKVHILSESPTYSNDITDRPVEGGSISDNVSSKPITLSVTGIVINGGWEALKQLRLYCTNGDIVSYSGRNAFGNMVIESFATDHDYKTEGGFKFNMSLKQIKVAIAKEVPFTAKVKTAGVKVTKSKKTNPEKTKQTVAKYKGEAKM